MGSAEKIPTRIGALQALQNTAAQSEHALKNTKLTRAQRADLLYKLGQRWEKADDTDPAVAISETETVVHQAAVESYRAAIAAAPQSTAAGYSSFRLLAFETPYETEGDYVPEVGRWLEEYGGFLRQYRNHPVSGEAMFMVAGIWWTSFPRRPTTKRYERTARNLSGDRAPLPENQACISCAVLCRRHSGLLLERRIRRPA